MYIFLDNWILLVPVVAFISLFIRWYKYGREPDISAKLDPEYDITARLTPIEVAAIHYETLTNSALIAEIIYLATQSFLRIERLEEDMGVLAKKQDFLLERLRDPKELKSSIDKRLLKELIPNKSGKTMKLSRLKKASNHAFQRIMGSGMRRVATRGYFGADPIETRSLYIGSAVAISIIVFPFVKEGYVSGMGVASIAVTVIMIGIFGSIMPQMTKKGIYAKGYIAALKEYLEEFKSDSSRFLNEIKREPAQFERLLPYAMALGVEDEWAKHFEGICKEPPAWYHRDHHNSHAFYPTQLISEINTFSDSVSSTLRSIRAHGGRYGKGYSAVDDGG